MTPRQWLMSLIASFLGVVIALLVVVLLGGAPGHNELYDRQAQMSNQINYLSCVLLLDPGERVPEVVAGCLQASTTE